MADVAGIILSPLLQVFFERMTSLEFVDFFRGRKLDEGLLKKLEPALLAVNSVVEDAEEKQLSNPAVRKWLDELKDAVYEAEDILDKIATEDTRRKLDAEFGSAPNKVRDRISASIFVHKIEGKIKEVLERLEDLETRKDVIGLTEGVRRKSSDTFAKTSLVEESAIFGRENDKEAIIDKLLSDYECGKEVGVIAIVGMAGIGKTALAKLVYNDKRVEDHFNLRVWCCVSEEFDPYKVTKIIMEAVTSTGSDFGDLNRLQLALKSRLMGRKLLLVLDDVWNRNHADWEVFSCPFKLSAEESRIIVTTREDRVASVMRSMAIFRPESLVEKDCWSLFTKIAFQDRNSDAYPELKAIGKEIVKKCRGLPLTVKTMGALLGSKQDLSDWDKILNSQLWDLPVEETNIFPALLVSYNYLPSHLKRCFAYCSIFPKSYTFKKNQLILLWMGEGFLQEYLNKTLEEVGNDYFCDLVSRSLFQQLGENKSFFVMHDVVNDLAKFVSGQFNFRMEIDHPYKTMKRTRHLSYFLTYFGDSRESEPLLEMKKLRSFLQLESEFCQRAFSNRRELQDVGHFKKFQPGQVTDWSMDQMGEQNFSSIKLLQDLFTALKYLRVLSLCHFKDIRELPDSIGKMIHLRYLDLSFSGVMRLPDSICKLMNLQTLKLLGCRNLKVLPRDFWRLVNLRHLNISDTCIEEMPIQLCRLKCLQTLTNFISSKSGGACIGELGKLVYLRGSVSISQLDYVLSPTDAKHASLKDRKNIEKLELHWNVYYGVSDGQETILDSLQPHTNLKSLIVKNYGAKSFPGWVGHPSFSKLTSLHLENAKHCYSLPPFGQLPFLEDLSIVGFDSVVKVGPEFYGSGGSSSSSVKPYEALKILRFTRMSKWEKWHCFGAENEGGAFPQLEELYIEDCPNLMGGLPVYLPALKILRFMGMRKWEKWHCFGAENEGQAFPQLEELCICGPFNLTEGLPLHLPSLKILRLTSMHKWEKWHCFAAENEGRAFPRLEELCIDNCRNLTEGLPIHLPSLVKLQIFGCPLLVASLPRAPALCELQLINCSGVRLNDLPTGMQKLTIAGFDALESLRGEIMASNSRLQQLVIRNCSSLTSVSRDGLPSSLKALHIQNCEKLGLPTQYSFLEDLRLDGCNSLTSLPLELFPKVYNLIITFCPNLASLTQEDNLETLRIEIGNCRGFVSFPRGGLRAPYLQSFSVYECENLRLLPEQMHMLLPCLEDLRITSCPKVESFPEGGLPSSLKSIYVNLCDKLLESRMGWDLQRLSSLAYLGIGGGESKVVESFPEAEFLPNSLTYLQIFDFRNLRSLKKGLQHLTSLQKLEISDCPMLQCMPEDGLLVSLSALRIRGCPLLVKLWKTGKGKEWCKIAHVHSVIADGRVIKGADGRLLK